ncbi:ionotropic receptor 21a-like [Ostrinia furnacalis]|uniref:ionotropic receptor 21a-like n=1 Tax=Ostrinia furnacalis TaxID=93504 RepID=UPI001040C3DF|nr:ionotropic receptor 21a-like [Ostrinia furnacalis]
MTDLTLCVHAYLATTKNPDLASCVLSIINKYFTTQITYVDILSDEDILRDMKDNLTNSIISRQVHVSLAEYNENYLVHVGTVADFVKEFPCLIHEPAWKPTVNFLIIFNEIETDIRDIFDVLLKLHVINVLVVRATDMNLYTYNPFENYGCGKRYDRLIHYGKCSQPNVANVYPEKVTTGLQRCNFNVETVHWPPFAINPAQTKVGGVQGVEQYILEVLAEIEHFNYTLLYTDNAERFSTIDRNMSVVGPLKALRDNAVDISMGGMLLLEERAVAFDVLWSHLPVDEVIILVKKAEKRYTWRYITMEFPPVVWILLVLVFLLYAWFMIKAFKVQDRALLILNMFGALLLHSVRMRDTAVTKLVWIYWVWFAFLIGSHYTTILTSLTTHPLEAYQISNEEDLAIYKLKSCVSPIMQDVSAQGKELTYKPEALSHGCGNLYQSMETH